MPTGQITTTRGDRDVTPNAPTVPPSPNPDDPPVQTIDGVITAIGPTTDLSKLEKQAGEVEEGVEYRVAYRDRDGVIHYEDVLRNHHTAAAERARFALKGERVREVWVEKRKIADWEATDVKGLDVDDDRLLKASAVRKITRDGDA